MASASDRTPSWFTSALAHIAWQSASDAAKAGNAAQAVAAMVTATSSFLMFSPGWSVGRLHASPPVARQQMSAAKGSCQCRPPSQLTRYGLVGCSHRRVRCVTAPVGRARFPNLKRGQTNATDKDPDRRHRPLESRSPEGGSLFEKFQSAKGSDRKTAL